jgi:predicted metal-binding protein
MHSLTEKAKSIPEIKAAALISTRRITFEPSVRDICAKNQCGGYGRNWSCPPDCGDIDTLIETARGFDNALVFQTVWPIEDCFDIEGMNAAQKKHFEATLKLRELLKPLLPQRFLTLSVVCKQCEECAKLKNQPCGHPESMISSLEAYGILVSDLAGASGMDYLNGENTVTYFGAILF